MDAGRAREVLALMTLLLSGAASAQLGDIVLSHAYWPPNRVPLSAAKRAARFLEGGHGDAVLPLELVTFRAAYCDQLQHPHGPQDVVTCVHIVLALTELLAAGYEFVPDTNMAGAPVLSRSTISTGVAA